MKENCQRKTKREEKEKESNVRKVIQIVSEMPFFSLSFSFHFSTFFIFFIFLFFHLFSPFSVFLLIFSQFLCFLFVLFIFPIYSILLARLYPIFREKSCIPQKEYFLTKKIKISEKIFQNLSYFKKYFMKFLI